MSMLTTFDALKKIPAHTSSAFASVLAQARSRHPVLATYDTVDALSTVVRPRSSVPARQRDRVLTALVVENQRAPHAVWQSLLLIAFEPMLGHLRAKLVASTSSDGDQELLLAFLDALRTVRAGAYTTLGVRWATEARLSAARRPAQDDLDEEYDEDIQGGTPLGATPDVKLEVSEILEMLEERGGQELVDAVIATEIGGESLQDYLASRYEGLRPNERARVYDRIARMRSDVFGRLRERLARQGAGAAGLNDTMSTQPRTGT